MLSHFSRVQLFATLWTVAHQAPLSTGFSRQEYWSGLPCPSPGAFPNPGLKPVSLRSPALAGRFFTASATWKYVLSMYKSKSSNQACVTRMLHELCWIHKVNQSINKTDSNYIQGLNMYQQVACHLSGPVQALGILQRIKTHRHLTFACASWIPDGK